MTELKTGYGHGYGKTILFGEHFVVHGIPAIVSALNFKTAVKIEETPGLNDIKFIDQARPSYGTLEKIFSREQDYILCKLTGILLKTLDIDIDDLSITVHLDSTIPEFGGVGSSAALAVSLTRAFNDYFKLGYNDEKINTVAYEGEKLFHGTPSGIDNSISTFGGLLWFVRSLQKGKKNILEPLKTPATGLLVIGDTKIAHNTQELVAEVRRRKESEPEAYNPIFEKARKIVYKARQLLENGNFSQKLGELMNENHILLNQVGVGAQSLDDLCTIALNSGAHGAKLTGAGGGGCMIALCSSPKIQEKIITEFQSHGFQGYKTTIGLV